MKRTKSDLLNNVTDYKSAKFVANNTLEIYYNDNSRAIRLHDTDVLTFKNNHVIVNTDSWKTVTTKARINEFSNLNIQSINSQWFINNYVYYDGITFDLQGNLLSKEIKDKSKEIKAMKKRITKYCNLITENNLPKPNAGDCWYCLFKDENGKTMSDLSNNYDHLLKHLDENYLHGSILVNAMLEYGYREEQLGLHYYLKTADTFKRAVRKYLQKRLIDTL